MGDWHVTHGADAEVVTGPQRSASDRLRRRPTATRCQADPGGDVPPTLPGLVSPQFGGRSLAVTGNGRNRPAAEPRLAPDSPGMPPASGLGSCVDVPLMLL